MLGERKSNGLDDDVVERRLVLVAHLCELLPQLGGASDVELGGEEERRNRAVRLTEALRDGLSDLGERDILEVAFGSQSVGGRGSSGGDTRRLRILDVALDDASARTRALNSAELDSPVVGEATSERRGALASIRRWGWMRRTIST